MMGKSLAVFAAVLSGAGAFAQERRLGQVATETAFKAFVEAALAYQARKSGADQGTQAAAVAAA